MRTKRVCLREWTNRIRSTVRVYEHRGYNYTVLYMDTVVRVFVAFFLPGTRLNLVKNSIGFDTIVTWEVRRRKGRSHVGMDGRCRLTCGQPWWWHTYGPQELASSDQKVGLQSSSKLVNFGACPPSDSIALPQELMQQACIHPACTGRSAKHAHTHAYLLARIWEP